MNSHERFKPAIKHSLDIITWCLKACVTHSQQILLSPVLPQVSVFMCYTEAELNATHFASLCGRFGFDSAATPGPAIDGTCYRKLDLVLQRIITILCCSIGMCSMAQSAAHLLMSNTSCLHSCTEYCLLQVRNMMPFMSCKATFALVNSPSPCYPFDSTHREPRLMTTRRQSGVLASTQGLHPCTGCNTDSL